LNLYAADAGLFHHRKLAVHLLLTDGRAEPPPAHEDPRIVGRVEKAVVQLLDAGSRALGRNGG
jgi:hypothetical protein